MNIRKFLIVLIMTTLWLGVATSAYAANEGEHERKTVATSADSTTSEKTDSAKADSAKTDNAKSPAIAEELKLLDDKVQRLEELVERQQRIIEALQARSLDPSTTNVATSVSPTVTTPVAANTSAITPTTTAPQAAAAVSEEQVKHLDALYKAFGSFNISGDVRFRYDGQFDQGFDSPTGVPDRNRLRIRARLQLAGQINKYLDYGVRIATGSFTNPSSTNQTFTDFFNRKPVGFDRYFIRYDSKAEQGIGVTLQAGKFDYPWKRTELTFDNDIQPEGAAETVYYKGKNFLKEAKFIAFQLPISEVSGGKDTFLAGGQLQATVGKGDFAFTGASTFLNFNQADNIARSLSRPNTQVGGGLELSTTNRVRRDAMGNIIGFVTNYNILDLIGEIKYNHFKKYPVTLVLNYARNMSDRLDKLRERNAYWTEFRVGQLKEHGDIEFGYTFSRVEQDAVLSVFSFDDFLATNSRNNRFTFGYTVNKNLFFQAIGLFSERFNTLPKSNSRVQKRIQLDINYRF